MVASLTFLTRRITISYTHILPLRFLTIPHNPISSHCRRPHFSSPSSPPPKPKKIPFEVSHHGRQMEDPYRWMSNTNDPDFDSYLHQENLYTEAFMADTVKLQQKLASEMKSRMPPQISTPPERWGPWLYYQYNPEGKEYPVLCRRWETQNNVWVNKLMSYAKGVAMQEILLDWNKIAEQYGYVHIGTCRVSPDHNFLAYTLDTAGDEHFTLHIKDLSTGLMSSRLIVDGVVSLAWAKDSRTLFYTVSNEAQRPYRVLCTKVDSDIADALPVFTETDPNFCVDITSTKDCKFITINSNSRTTSEVYLIDANNPQDGPQRVWKREHRTKYFLEHHYDIFYILTNAPLSGDGDIGGESFYLAMCKANEIQSTNWQNIILPGEDVIFVDMDIFDKHLVLFLEKQGSPMICSISLPFSGNSKYGLKIDDLNSWFFPLPSGLCRVVPGSNHDFMAATYRVVLSSPVMPDIIVDYDMLKQKFSTVQHEEEIDTSTRYRSRPLSFDADEEKILVTPPDNRQHIGNVETEESHKKFSEALTCERRAVLSHDGVLIPLTILFSPESHQKSQSPGILLGYGAYGEGLDKSWSTDRQSLIDRGWVVAFADVRGGGGGDPSWHRAGTGFQKLNSILDFVACGNYLIDEGYVHNERLCAAGHSAGGLLVGAAINMHPHLFRAAILKVPFLDVCNTLLDPSLPLTTLDYEEFGDPQIQAEFETIYSYSPYDNIPPAVCMPSMLVTASFRDTRVGVWEAAKWVAKVREQTCSHCSHSVILKTDMTGGHFGEGGRFAQCEEMAYEYAFLMKAVGIFDGNE